MYQVLIVDDEKDIREGLSSWDWNSLNACVAGCCSNGLEALRLISANPVDIVLTDIQMPFVSGLELMEELESQFPYIHTILLSGHSEFEYARKGMQMGAVDYLLKPITYDSLAKTMLKLTAKLDEQNQLQYRMSVLKRRSRQLTKALRSEFLNRMFVAPITPEDIEYNGAAGELLLNADVYTAAIVRLDKVSLNQASISPVERGVLTSSMDMVLNMAWDEAGHGYHLMLGESGCACLLAIGAAGKDRFDHLQRQLMKYKGLFRSTVSIVAGPSVGSLANIFKSMGAARASLPGLKENITLLCPAFDEAESPDEQAAKPDEHADCIGQDGQSNAILIKARKYMQEHYQRSITIKEVAGTVFVSPGYLSALFKGNNDSFLKHLTTLRIDRAKQLMDDPKLKIYDIVEMVGYSDPAYFSEIFKKVTGKTPNEYRGHRKAEADA